MAKKSKKVKKSFLEKKYSIFLPLIIFLTFVIQGINLPFVGYNAWNFNIYSLIAHNFTKFGILDTKFAPIINAAEVLPRNPEYYLHHPQLLSIIESGVFRLLGESFATGRLTVIFFSAASLILIYLIGTQILGKKGGIISAFIYSVLPASVLFGRMIGQEPLVLFFVLLAVHSLLQYIKSRSGTYLVIIFLSIILGTLSDWPMVYFTLCLFPYLWVLKQKILGLKIIATSFITALLFMMYLVYFNELENLFGAFLVRSPGALLRESFWGIKWIVTIATRILFYFNPVIIFSSLAAVYVLVKKTKKRTPEDILIIGLVFFGIIHILLYPEGSFGHPYWIYYLIPSVTLLSAKFFNENLISKKFVLIVIVTLSIIYLIGVNRWKLKEIESNIYRYKLAKAVNAKLKPYEKILMNNTSVIDQDLMLYPFLHESKLLQHVSKKEFIRYDHLIYSCTGTCGEDKDLLNLKNKYYFDEIRHPSSHAIVFSLKKSPTQFITNEKKLKERPISNTIELQPSNSSVPRRLYNKFLELTGAPQL